MTAPVLHLPRRRRRGKASAAVLLVALLLLAVRTYLAQPKEGQVVGVSDGDTIRVMAEGKEEKVRLFGVDCPEKDMPFGSAAKQFTSDLVFGKPVRVQKVASDRYGRIVAEVLYREADGAAERSLNAALAEAGLAWAYREYSQRFVPQEDAARAAKRGLWAQENPEPPWAHRKTQREEQED
ncbi:MAG: thermonuclease family protein [Planctomycetes bacterium]|nr:thermonuclease family protein [Planctomycetota bacterium]